MTVATVSRSWSPWKRLLARGVLGINRRNIDYVFVKNARSAYPSVDDKLQTKAICQASGIRVPKTYAVVERHGDLARLERIIHDLSEFVVKPSRGAAGRGLTVVVGTHAGAFETATGARIDLDDLRYHVAGILSGLHSLGGRPDRAIIEQRVRPHPVFDAIACGGTPDVRVVLYDSVPAMAMVRLPTRASRGRANLHQGAAGAGIDLVTGRIFGGVCKDRMVSRHPDTGVPLEGLLIPQWNELLTAATRSSRELGMAYLGVDFVVDSELGPLLLEANARPGLAIQTANRMGLLPRLRTIDDRSVAMTRAERDPGDRSEMIERGNV